MDEWKLKKLLKDKQLTIIDEESSLCKGWDKFERQEDRLSTVLAEDLKDGKQEEVSIEIPTPVGEDKLVEEEEETAWKSSEDYFEEMEKRNKALEDALRGEIGEDFPPVYIQAKTLLTALQERKTLLKPLSYYISELRSYLERKQKVFSSLPLGDNLLLQQSNSFMQDGLMAMLEVVKIIEEHSEDLPGLVLADQLLNQANEFFIQAKQALLSLRKRKE